MSGSQDHCLKLENENALLRREVAALRIVGSHAQNYRCSVGECAICTLARWELDTIAAEREDLTCGTCTGPDCEGCAKLEGKMERERGEGNA